MKETTELQKKRVLKIIKKLNKAYPDAKCALTFKNPLELVVATILSAQCTDKRVNLPRGRPRIVNADGEWTYRGNKPSMYDVEHQELFAGIRNGNHINNGVYMSYSTLMAIIGREACYTGKVIEWDKALNSQQQLGPKKYEWGDVEVPDVAIPGATKFA